MGTIKIINRTGIKGLTRGLSSLAKRFLKEHRRDYHEIVVYVVGDEEMKGINQAVFGRRGPTDVITVPTELDPIEAEIFLDWDTISRNARLYGTDPEWELKFCLLHGLLHAMGWEDDTPSRRRKMLKLQEEFLSSYYEEAD